MFDLLFDRDDHKYDLVRVVAPHFVAGFVIDGVVRRAAPILAYMIGWTDQRAFNYITKKRWTYETLATPRGCSPWPVSPTQPGNLLDFAK